MNRDKRNPCIQAHSEFSGEAEKAQTAAKEIFVSGGAAANMPTTTLTDADFTDGRSVSRTVVKCGLASSNGEARKLVQGGGVSLNGEKVADFKQQLAGTSLTRSA